MQLSFALEQNLLQSETAISGKKKSSLEQQQKILSSPCYCARGSFICIFSVEADICGVSATNDCFYLVCKK